MFGSWFAQRSVKCNSFDQGVQCAGFAYLCYYKCHGYLRSSRIGTRYVVGNEGIRAGDVIRMSGHTAFVWNVNGDQLSILEANYGASCRIDHSRTVRASEVLHYWTPKAYVLHYNANGGQGSPNAKIVPIDTPYTLGDGALWRRLSVRRMDGIRAHQQRKSVREKWNPGLFCRSCRRSRKAGNWLSSLRGKV